MAAVRLAVHARIPAARRATDGFILGFYHWHVVVVVVCAAVAAGVAAAIAPGHRVLHGLLAAFACAILAALGVQLILPTLGSCVAAFSLVPSASCPRPLNLDAGWQTARTFAAVSAPPALVAAVLAATVRDPRRRRGAATADVAARAETI